jgi:hypothetical protein
VKRCFKCGTQKPLSEFYRHPMMTDGHLGKCKECAKADATATRLAKIEHYREYDRARASLPHRIEQRREIINRWRGENPDRKQAHSKLRRALLTGRIQELPCLICGEKAEAHHPDYTAPLDVVWLCSPHHKQAHAMARKAA